MPKPTAFDAIIIGAGAAGMFCAALAGQRGRRVLLIDHSAEPGRKILARGRVGWHNGRRAIYNPWYELKPNA